MCLSLLKHCGSRFTLAPVDSVIVILVVCLGDGCCLGFGTECGRRENNLSGNPMIIKSFHNCVRRPEKINPKEARVALTHCF